MYQAHPNEFSPVSESAYCGAGVVNTILLHTNPRSGVLTIFPGVTASWSDVAFHKLRAAGGLVVSAKRSSGTTQFVRLWATTQRQVSFVVAGDSAWAGNVIPQTVPEQTVVRGSKAGEWVVSLETGAHVVVYMAPAAPPFVISALAGNSSEYHYFGFTRPMQPLH